MNPFLGYSPFDTKEDGRMCHFSSHIVAFTSDRTVDFTLPEGQDELAPLQKEFLKDQLQVDLPEVVNIRQVHGNKIVVATKDSIGGGRFETEADGLVTNVCRLPIAVRTADCLPIFIYDPRQECIGLIHVGWRGFQKGIVIQALRCMNERFGSQPKDMRVAFGPAIRDCCYEVGEEFKEYFPADIIHKDRGYYLALSQLSKKKLLDLKVEEKNVSDCGICTCCDKTYFSYRRQGNGAGRMISLMMLRER